MVTSTAASVMKCHLRTASLPLFVVIIIIVLLKSRGTSAFAAVAVRSRPLVVGWRSSSLASSVESASCFSPVISTGIPFHPSVRRLHFARMPPQQRHPLPRRQSPRLLALLKDHASATDDGDETKPKRKSRPRNVSPEEEEDFGWIVEEDAPKRTRTKRSATVTTSTSGGKKVTTARAGDETTPSVACLPRQLEHQARKKMQARYDCDESQCLVMGIDEAGRGPLAGPVVIAGVVCPHDIPGVVDSKKITKEETREAVFQDIMTLQQAKTGTDMEWAVCVMDAAKIDQINILQATLEGMKAVAQTIVGVSPTVKTIHDDGKQVLTPLRIVKEASIQEEGCYVVCSDNVLAKHDTSKRSNHTFHYHALVDGNRLPKSGMPCPAEPIVKGDSKEFSIAAASILAKVTRDRLMHEYDKLYPEYNLQQHKGYPTAKHMDYVTKHGASKIHRRSFAPLRHMALDENGKIVE